MLRGAATGAPAETDPREVFWRRLAVQGSTVGSRRQFAALLPFFDRVE